MNSSFKLKALCRITGSSEYSSIHGIVFFYEGEEGVWIKTNISGLPVSRSSNCGGNAIFAFHIHEGSSCTGTMSDPFQNAMGHFNPTNCPHPYHAGDLPPLFANRDGVAEMAFLNDRFSVEEVIGRVMIIHRNPDDFHTQPSGNSGPMIACGKIISA